MLTCARQFDRKWPVRELHLAPIVCFRMVSTAVSPSWCQTLYNVCWMHYYVVLTEVLYTWHQNRRFQHDPSTYTFCDPSAGKHGDTLRNTGTDALYVEQALVHCIMHWQMYFAHGTSTGAFYITLVQTFFIWHQHGDFVCSTDTSIFSMAHTHTHTHQLSSSYGI